MKYHPVTGLLVGILILCVLATAALSYYYIQSIRRVQRLQVVAARINSERNLIQAMANEAVEYSKRNPAIDPVLQSLGVKPKPASSTNPAQ